MQINNPFINQAKSNTSSTTFTQVAEGATRKGISLKTLFLLIVGIAAGAIVGFMFRRQIQTYIDGGLSDNQMAEFLRKLLIFAIVASVAQFIGYLIGRLSLRLAAFGAVVYAVGEGSLIGILCGAGEIYVPGVTVVAGGATIAIVGLTYLAYALNLRKHMSKIGIFALVYALGLILTVIGLSLYSVLGHVSWNTYFTIEMVIAALYIGWGILMLLMTFWEAEIATENGLDKRNEWSIALGILYAVFLIFVYVFRIIILIAANSEKR